MGNNEFGYYQLMKILEEIKTLLEEIRDNTAV